jgi:hypothetical protein
VRLLHVSVEGLDIEAQLSEVLGFELPNFELESNEAGEAPVEEDEVDREIPTADLNRILRADEAEVAPELADEPTKVAEKRAMEVGLGVLLRQAQKLQAVLVLEVFEARWVNLCHRR